MNMNWISVKDKLPTDYQKIIAYGLEDINTCTYYYEHWIVNYELEGDDIDLKDITHWMPIPNPPKETK